jgi:hypothetical protein
MKNMTNNELSARINRFIDRKLPKMSDLSDLADHKAFGNGHRRQVEVSDTQFIALAIK